MRLLSTEFFSPTFLELGPRSIHLAVSCAEGLLLNLHCVLAVSSGSFTLSRSSLVSLWSQPPLLMLAFVVRAHLMAPLELNHFFEDLASMYRLMDLLRIGFFAEIWGNALRSVTKPKLRVVIGVLILVLPTV